MTNRELQIFMTVVECGKMNEAAKRLYITQSSVSQAISSIEREYNILLFERISNSLYLTADGAQLAAHARGFFSAKKDMEEFLTNASRNYRLNVGATVTVGTCVISPILRSVRALLPDIDFHVNVANTHIIEEMLLKNEIDVGLVEGRVNSPDLITKAVIEDNLVLICAPSHRFAERTNVDVTELEGEALILREVGSGTRERFVSQMAARHIKMDIKWSCYNSDSIKAAVRDGHGISVISRRLVEEDIAHGRLHACDIDNIDLHRYFAVVYHKSKFFSEELKTFITACEDFADKA